MPTPNHNTLHGILVSGLVVALISWAIQMRGPLLVLAFNPLSLVIVAFFGSIFLDETLHLGSVVGAGLIILGLYTVLWGKGKEVKELVQLQAHRSAGEATKLDSDGLHSNPAGAGIGADQVPEHSIKEDQIDSGHSRIFGVSGRFLPSWTLFGLEMMKESKMEGVACSVPAKSETASDSGSRFYQLRCYVPNSILPNVACTKAVDGSLSATETSERARRQTSQPTSGRGGRNGGSG
ncbi:hypothetical protein EJ110_NYTH46059 [Nymphaea thermarum]|nr:hypothetical protein EJ110_NYTH46059 [Nymphaea thermarum]